MPLRTKIWISIQNVSPEPLPSLSANARSIISQTFKAPSFSLSQSTPSKIFTPNGDGFNDRFNLTFSNPKGSIISEKKIFDITGSKVANFKVAGDETASLVTLYWNGRSDEGSKVRSGVYLYQVQADGEIINGTVVVIR